MFKGEQQNKPAKNVETVIGPSVKVEGDFKGDGDVIVEGTVIGNLSTKNHLRIGRDAKVQAEINSESAFIAGEIIGNITVTDSVDLTSTAKVKGDINASSLSIEKGAVVNGKISMNGNNKKVELVKEKESEVKE